MDKEYYNWKNIEGACLDIARQLNADNYKPDYIVGLTRGGLVPAVLLSQFLDVPMETLKISLRDGGETETNCWMAEDAYNGVKILVVDDINDSGATLNWLRKDWESSCQTGEHDWETVWHNTVKFAAITDNLASDATVDYSVKEVNKAENDVWLVYPWENFWNAN